jgi:ATP-dependent DNA ligase
LSVTFVAFDALAVAGADLRALQCEARRGKLGQLLADARGALWVTPVLAPRRGGP